MARTIEVREMPVVSPSVPFEPVAEEMLRSDARYAKALLEEAMRVLLDNEIPIAPQSDPARDQGWDRVRRAEPAHGHARNQLGPDVRSEGKSYPGQCVCR